MQRATVMRGVSVHAADPPRLAEWYATHFGIQAVGDGIEAPSASREHPSAPSLRLLRASPACAPSDWSVEFSVPDLSAMLSQLRAVGTDVGPVHQDDSGSYAELHDPEGHAVRLRQEAENRVEVRSSDETAVRVLGSETPADRRHPGSRGERPKLWARWAPLVIVLVAAVAVVLVIDPGTDSGGAGKATSDGGAGTSVTGEPSAANRAPAVRVTDVGHPLFGISADWELFVGAPRSLLRLELAAGRITRTALPGLDADDTTRTVVGQGRVLVRTRDALSTFVVPDGEPAHRLAKSGSAGLPFFPGPRPGTGWVPGGQSDRPALSLVGPGYGGRGESIAYPASGFTPLMGDQQGNVLFAGVGGTYVGRPGGLDRVADGRLLAVGPTTLLTLECDDRGRCFDVVTDRDTGDARVLPKSPVHRVGVLGVISPDGSTAAIVRPAEQYRSTLWVIDLSTGDSRPIAPMRAPYDGGKLVWSPDGEWLFAVSRGELVAFESGAFQPRHLDASLSPVLHVALRPAPAA